MAFEAILVVNVVGELQLKRTLAASRGFLAAARPVQCCAGIGKPACRAETGSSGLSTSVVCGDQRDVV